MGERRFRASVLTWALFAFGAFASTAPCHGADTAAELVAYVSDEAETAAPSRAVPT